MLKLFGRDAEDLGAEIPGVRHPFANESGEVLGSSKPKRNSPFSRLSKMFNARAIGDAVANSLSVAKDEITASASSTARLLTGSATQEDKAQVWKATKFLGTVARNVGISVAAKTAFVSGATVGAVALAPAAIPILASATVAAGWKAWRISREIRAENATRAPEDQERFMSWKTARRMGLATAGGALGGVIGLQVHDWMGSPSLDSIKHAMGFGAVDADTLTQTAPAAAVIAPAAEAITDVPAPSADVLDTPEAPVVEAAPATPVENTAPAVANENAAPVAVAATPTLSVSETQSLKDQAVALYQSGGSQEDVVRAIELYEQAAQGTGPGAIQAQNDLDYLKNIGVYQTAMDNPVSPSSLADTAGSGETETGSGSAEPQVTAPVASEAAPAARPTIASRCSAAFDRIIGYDQPRMSMTCDMPADAPVRSGEALEISTNGVDGNTPYAQNAINGGADTTVGDMMSRTAPSFRDRMMSYLPF